MGEREMYKETYKEMDTVRDNVRCDNSTSMGSVSKREVHVTNEIQCAMFDRRPCPG